MGTIEDRARKRLINLGARCLLGRHSACDVRVEAPRVSAEHASVHWVGGRWELRDLGSRNGTFFEGRRLLPGERVPLAEAAEFSLAGADATFALVDASPPGAAAEHQATGMRRAASGGMLLLPDEELPLVSVFEDAAGHWVAEIEDEVRPVVDREILQVAGAAWVLELPPRDSETWQGDLGTAVLENLHLRLEVSPDEERVMATVELNGEVSPLPTRSYHYMLVTLARAWLRDCEAPAAQRGWVAREALCRMLATDLNKLNVDIHRARKQFAQLGIQNAAGIVERRPGTGELRIGVRNVEVVRA